MAARCLGSEMCSLDPGHRLPLLLSILRVGHFDTSVGRSTTDCGSSIARIFNNELDRALPCHVIGSWRIYRF